MTECIVSKVAVTLTATPPPPPPPKTTTKKKKKQKKNKNKKSTYIGRSQSTLILGGMHQRIRSILV